MIVCDKKKIIFFHIPKTAGSFIERALCKQIGIAKWQTEWDDNKNYIKHMRPDAFFQKYPNKRHYVKFSVCRNPWDYALSFYSMLTQWPKFASVTGHEAKKTGRIHPMNDYRDFNEYIELADQRIGPELAVDRLYDILSNPITRFLTGGESLGQELGMNHMIRFEHLQDDINDIFPKIGLEPIDCNARDSSFANGEPRDCSSRHEHYTKVYSEKSKKIIEKRNTVDCERFKYEFGR